MPESILKEKLVKLERQARSNMRSNARRSRHRSIRRHLVGGVNRPRLSVFRSSQHIYAQIIDDTKRQTLVSQSDKGLSGKKSERAFMVGKNLAATAVQKDIKKVVFDRGGFLYHGRIAALAQGAREGGLEF